MGREIYNIINDMAEVLSASQMQKLQEVLVNRLSENNVAVNIVQISSEKMHNHCKFIVFIMIMWYSIKNRRWRKWQVQFK